MRKSKFNGIYLDYNRTFRCHIVYAIGAKDSVVKEYFKKEFSTNKDLPNSEAYTTAITTKAGQFYIFISSKKKTNYPALAHECLHAANFILERIGHKTTGDNDEVNAYLMTDILERYLEFNKNQKGRKNAKRN